MEPSAIRGAEVPGFAALHPGYKPTVFINTLLAIVARPPFFAREIHARKKSSEIINLKN
jgi:hypothetical protein